MRRICTLLFIVICSFCECHLFAQTYHKEIPEAPNPPHLVNDLAGMMSASEALQLETKLLDFERKSSNEVTIVTVANLGDLDVATFALEIGRKWDIGKETKKNGVLILASKDDRKINISPGYGLSGVLPDIICGRIIRDHIVPNFKEGNYYAGFDEATNAIIEASTGEFTAAPQASPVGAGFMFFFILFAIIMIFVFFFLIRNRKGMYISRRGYKYDDRGWNSPSGGGAWFGGSNWGGGNDDSGGGFGGFGGFGGGGGGFDGGGASGSW
jgi:uncharacterized protein